MAEAAALVELWRGDILESHHLGHAVICDEAGEIVQSWGDPERTVYPRSSCKMVQALPLIESGAADDAGLTDEHLALACASHNGAKIHTSRVEAWLGDLGFGEGDLRCGPQMPDDRAAREGLIRAHGSPCQIHNNCSGKHAGFLTLNRHLGAGPEYIDPDHPVQKAVRAAFEEATGEPSPGFGIDGCSAPNFATSLHGLARAMSRFAAATEADARGRAMVRLRSAMMKHPELVAGEGRCCTALMRVAKGRAAIKTGAEGVFVAILPERKLGVALKIADGATRASECAIAAILVKLGLLEHDDPAVRNYLDVPVLSRSGLHAGAIRTAPGFP